MDPRRFHYHINSAKILKIKKDIFVKLIASKINKDTFKYAEDKMTFLSDRINYLARNTNKNIHLLLYKELEQDCKKFNLPKPKPPHRSSSQNYKQMR